MSYSIEEIHSRTEIVPYVDAEVDPEGFDCGKDWFNEFINTDEIEEYHQEQFGITRLVYFDGELVAYFSLSANALRDSDYEGHETEYVDGFSDYPYDVPAYLLGHLAVVEEHQRSGIGDYLLKRAIAKSKKSNIPFRVLLLHAHEDVVEFYERNDFTASECEEGFPKMMFMDLAKISDPP